MGHSRKAPYPSTKEINNTLPLRTSYTNLRHSLDIPPSPDDGNLWVFFEMTQYSIFKLTIISHLTQSISLLPLIMHGLALERGKYYGKVISITHFLKPKHTKSKNYSYLNIGCITTVV